MQSARSRTRSGFGYAWSLKGVVARTKFGPREDWKSQLRSGCGGGLPRPESFFSEDAERAAGCEMALDVEDPMESG